MVIDRNRCTSTSTPGATSRPISRRPSEGGRRCRHPQLRRRPGVHSRPRRPSEARPIDTDGLRTRARSRGRPLELVPEHPVGRRDDRARDVCARMRDRPGRGRRRGAVRRGHGLLRAEAPRPVVHVKAIHHRKAPVFHDPLRRRGVELGRPARRGDVLALLAAPGAGRQGRDLQPRRLRLLPLRRAMRPERAGWSKQAIMATFAAFPLKMVTVVDDDVDIRNPLDVEWAMATGSIR